MPRRRRTHRYRTWRRGVLQHEGGDGSTAAQRVSRAGYRWRSVGENIASGQDSVEQVMADWTSSPKHCANLMDPRFTEMGLGYAVNPDSEGGIYWAQELAGRAPERKALAPGQAIRRPAGENPSATSESALRTTIWSCLNLPWPHTGKARA